MPKPDGSAPGPHRSNGLSHKTLLNQMTSAMPRYGKSFICRSAAMYCACICQTALVLLRCISLRFTSRGQSLLLQRRYLVQPIRR